ncbi:MAG: two pore domain potassium channel family protein [Chloroflexota bacterium]|nr:MAG: two pore domain potassium channel family protein [Chloroflexota bacterium]
MFLFILVTTLAIVASVLLHLGSFQVLVKLWEKNTSLRRWRIAVLIVGFIIVHLIEIAVFSLAIDTLLQDGSFGHLEGVDVESAGSLFYYSAITYTTVGYGDITPIGDIRLFAGVEALTGMVLVAWTASAIFTVTHRTWRAEQAEKTPA